MAEEPKKSVKDSPKSNPSVALASEYNSKDKEAKLASKISYKASDRVTIDGEVGTKVSYKDKISASTYGAAGATYKASETTTIGGMASYNPIKKQAEVKLASENQVSDKVNIKGESVWQFDGKKNKSSVWNSIDTTYNPHKKVGLTGGVSYVNTPEMGPLLTTNQGVSVKLYEEGNKSLKIKAEHSFDVINSRTHSVKGEVEGEIGKVKANVWGGGIRDEKNSFGGAVGAGIKFKF